MRHSIATGSIAMCRFIATLTVSLAIVPLTHAQPAGQPGQQPQIPWVRPVPPVTPVNYGRPPSDQDFLMRTLLYSGYYGPYFNYEANVAPSTGGPPNSYAGNPQNPYSQNGPKGNNYAPERRLREQPLSSAAYPNHEPLLEGLAGLKLGEVHPQRGDIVDARAWMRRKELTTLMQSVDGNPMIYRNAERLTERLQASGMLHAGDRVVGFADGKVYVLLGSVR